MTLLDGPPGAVRTSIGWASIALVVVVAFVSAIAGVLMAQSSLFGRSEQRAVPTAISHGADTRPPLSHVALPRMTIQAQYGGPLQDTLIQRLRDPVDGTICYVYLPIVVHHQPVDRPPRTYPPETA